MVSLGDNGLSETEDDSQERIRELIELRARRDQLNTRELDSFNRELERMKTGKTREEWYGAEQAEHIKQKFKFIKSKHS